MNIRTRLDRLESERPPTESFPWEVVVTRRIVVPGPDGPRTTGRTITSRWVDGKLVDRTERE